MSVIREYRKKRKLTQVQLSERVEASLPTIKRWEAKTHVPTLLQARDICEALRLPFTKLYNDYKEETK